MPQPRGDVMPEPTMHVDDVSPLTYNPNPSPSPNRALALSPHDIPFLN